MTTEPNTNTLNELLENLAGLLQQKGETLSTAESCTGGMVASELVGLPGASVFFKGGACTYWNDAKRDILGVPQDTLDRFGAVSEETALAMAEGARRIYKTDWAVSTTGTAGPDGGTKEKPVGLVRMAVVSDCKKIVFCEEFSGNRGQIRQKSVFKVLDALRGALSKKKMNRKAHTACRKCSGRRRILSSGDFRSEFPFGSCLGQAEKSQNSPSEKVLKTQKNPAEIRRFQPDLVGVSGFEPEASWSRTKRDTKLRHTPKA